jgi:hypothetical protein
MKVSGLPSKYLVQKHENKILDEGGGFEVEWERNIIHEIEQKTPRVLCNTRVLDLHRWGLDPSSWRRVQDIYSLA